MDWKRFSNLNEWKRRGRRGAAVWLLACLLAPALAGCGQLFTGGGQTPRPEAGPGIVLGAGEEIGSVHLRDKDLLYTAYDPTSVVTMYLTVTEGNASDGTDHTWEEINTWSAYDYEEWGVERYKVNALLQVGDEKGVTPGELGYDRSTPNATVQIRGQTSSRYAQKNYKVRLRENQGVWRGQQTIALNKHQVDGMRFRNKLGFDLLSEIPQVMSLRTQFVHLYVKDLTAGADPAAAVFEDYGLYTQVEQLNRTALRAHGLDRNGHLYKINFMEFYPYEEIVEMDDPSYDQAAFEALLETKGSQDHSKLIRMLNAVNDYTLSSDELLEEYFDAENIAYWMAFMILTGNIDTQNRNFYIYSPLQSEHWYILPWDNDALLMNRERELVSFVDSGSWEAGVSNYWGNMLFRRALQSRAFRELLDSAVEELRTTVLSEDHVRELCRKYAAVTRPYIYRMPDQMHAKLTEAGFDEVVESMAAEVEQNYEAYETSLKKPLPFFVGVPETVGDRMEVQWDTAYDFEGQDVTYSVTLARDYEYTDVIYAEEGLRVNRTSFEALAPGQYFLRVRARNAAGYEQDCFDYYLGGNGGKVYGTMCFYVGADGSVEVEEIVE